MTTYIQHIKQTITTSKKADKKYLSHTYILCKRNRREKDIEKILHVSVKMINDCRLITTTTTAAAKWNEKGRNKNKNNI